MRLFKFFSVLFCLVSLGLFAEGSIRDNATGETFPEEVSFEHGGKEFHLKATGVATRKKFFVKVYSVAHYLEEAANQAGGDRIQIIMQDDNAKQLTLKWQRSIDGHKVQEGYQESFRNALSNVELSQLQNQINEYLNYFSQGVHKGDEHVIRWLPGGYIEVIINGNSVGSITSKQFAKGLWSIWFGTKSVVDKERLISLMK